MDLHPIKTHDITALSAMSSPGLYNPNDSFPSRPSPAWASSTPAGSPYLHPLQMHRVKETHKAEIDQDNVTGRKLINQYEILGEIGRGVHGKVKLARNLETGEKVAIKIIQRYSKKRRLTRVNASPEAKTKREIAILKKIRHPDIVGLYEVIDDPDYKKIYMILEYVELGEIKWRRKGASQICAFERRRIERELRGEDDGGEDEKLFRMLERRRIRKDAQRAKLTEKTQSSAEFWSLEHGDDEDDFGDATPLSRVSTHESLFIPRSFQSHTSHTSLVRSTPSSKPASRAASCTPSRAGSIAHHKPLPTDYDNAPIESDNEDGELGPLPSIPSTLSSAAGGLGNINNLAHRDEPANRGRSPSMADSIISHMSSVDDIVQHDSFEEDFSYVPCFTMDQARSTFRDTVLGLEYLHYEGIVHRDIKPANLLWTKEHRVKISDFGVSYFGRPMRDGEQEETVSESEGNDFDDDIELSKTVGTPAFFAPELCYTDLDIPQPKINDQIDVWSLGVTLYCLIFARIPFLADDEYQLFKAIAQQDVYIPRRRLKAVNPGIPDPDDNIKEGDYREDGELVMEDIDDELHDLIRRMLIKDPAERIKLREVKRHPWVLRGIDNIIGWLDDTDPSRRTAGKRIQVDDRELERAVVPISFVERARSAVKKAVGKVLGRGEGSRKRATSTATSSGDGGSTPHTPIRDRDARRASTRGDESYFGSFADHPLSRSVAASPQHTPHLQSESSFGRSDPISISSSPGVGAHHHYFPAFRPSGPNRTISTAESILTLVPSDKKDESPPQSPRFTGSSSYSLDPMSSLSGHFPDGSHDAQHTKNTPKMDPVKRFNGESNARTRSADRAPVHDHSDVSGRHSEAHPGVFKAFADVTRHTVFGHHNFYSHHHSWSTDTSPTSSDHNTGNPLLRASLLSRHKQSMSSPVVNTRNFAAALVQNQSSLASHAAETAQIPARLWEPTTDSVEKEHESLDVPQRPGAGQVATYHPSPSTSPEGSSFPHIHTRNDVQEKSSSSINSFGARSPIAMSPTDLTSPVSSVTLGSSQDRFPSHPSLPALVSGASSISADQESDTITHISSPPPLRDSESSDSVTPPTLSKLNSRDDATDPVILGLHRSDEQIEHAMYAAEAQRDREEPPDHFSRDAADDSDSDEGLTMGGGRCGKVAAAASRNTTNQIDRAAAAERGKELARERQRVHRRNTNNSIGSTGTAKKVGMDD